MKNNLSSPSSFEHKEYEYDDETACMYKYLFIFLIRISDELI